ncbi:PHP domain-containing protein [Candidatus Saganbacteria bacterium CG08_land_8_20_14_0_20_45_16]|uniref:PHP domain-containing protein n=1 Tax=Candidatus Saganbacteria bacterium CG08_land_8_20_14_0_20_45_16 TaxID=2014293 RepID=A0A2H0Y1P2_UNCSA|nr:MAG: PHP domain-containing protein [Candidatus Saganbacteria bacterium CG08_land_8_20_14_0_20_45_16]
MKDLGPRIDFHTHTISSDGLLLPSALVYEAALRGQAAIAITDHVDASNLDEVIFTLTKFVKNQGQLPIKVLPGVELSYLPPAQIRKYAERAKKLGAKIIIVHGESPVEPAVPAGTNHAALQLKGLVDILAHPGNITEEDTILAKVNNIYLELSARKGHRDGNRHVAKLAKQFGAKLLVNTDAHCEHDLISQKQAYQIAKEAGLKKGEALITVGKNPQELLKRT